MGIFHHDPFTYRKWGSDVETLSPDNFATRLANSLYIAYEPGGMTFTTNREEFPPFDGIPPESILVPGVTFVQVVYSEGWGLIGLGTAMLYYAQDECGGYY